EGEYDHVPAVISDVGGSHDLGAQADTLAFVDGAQDDSNGSEGRVPRADPHESRSPLQRVPAPGSDAAGIAWRSGTPHVGPGGATVVADLEDATIEKRRGGGRELEGIAVAEGDDETRRRRYIQHRRDQILV